MKLEFYGSSETPTGAMQMLAFEGFNILLDCGLFEGSRQEAERRNLELPFEPSRLHSVVLTHAHLAHCGSLPTIVRQGFGGTVFATRTTQDLCGALLRDTAFMAEHDVEKVNERRAADGRRPLDPLHTIEDAERSLYHFNGLSYHRAFHILRDVRCAFFDAGHLLGSALAVLDVKTFDGEHRVVYAGDLGRSGMPLLRNPEVPTDVNTLVLGAVCGGKRLASLDRARTELAALATDALEQGGRIVIPDFSFGAALRILHLLLESWDKKELRRAPVYIDSPLSVNVAELFRHHSDCYDAVTRTRILKERDPFGFGRLQYVRGLAQSEELAASDEPCLVVAPTNSCETGTILRHLRHTLADPRHLILLADCPPKNTLARRLADGADTVRILDEETEVRARTVVLEDLGGHADQDEILNFVHLVSAGSKNLRNIFVVHGEPDQCAALADRISREIGIEPAIPTEGGVYEI
ncbi:MAG TPA: MBL fold metallo-hydrolase [Sumerlaeia bacterium]|nr:MBL fold metallo-hydrolase [Sumerlaeia bacterium]